MIYLVDLNFTLAVSHFNDRRPMAERLATEEYRGWLVELLRPQTAVIVTARPARWMDATLRRLEELHGWRPAAAYFNYLNLAPPVLKARLFAERIRPRFGDVGYFGLESNPRTRAAYARLGVQSLPIPRDCDPPWKSLPPWPEPPSLFT